MMDWLYDNWLWLFYISEWIIRLAMLPVVTRKRQPISAMAWLLAIFLVPWLGLLLYALLGQYRLPRKRTKRHARLYRELVTPAASSRDTWRQRRPITNANSPS